MCWPARFSALRFKSAFDMQPHLYQRCFLGFFTETNQVLYCYNKRSSFHNTMSEALEARVSRFGVMPAPSGPNLPFEALRADYIQYLHNELHVDRHNFKIVHQTKPTWAAYQELALAHGGDLRNVKTNVTASACPRDELDHGSDGCARQLLRQLAPTNETSSIVLVSFVTSAAPDDARRFIAYYMMLGVTSGIVFDNLCNSSQLEADMTAALTPFENRIQHHTASRCHPWTGKLQMHLLANAWSAHESWGRHRGISFAKYPLILRMDVDECAPRPKSSVTHARWHAI